MAKKTPKPKKDKPAPPSRNIPFSKTSQRVRLLKTEETAIVMLLHERFPKRDRDRLIELAGKVRHAASGLIEAEAVQRIGSLITAIQAKGKEMFLASELVATAMMKAAMAELSNPELFD